jgi:oxaloacetate decarboxylase gamma subunit
MSENFQLALQLLGVGMITVFAILFLVVFIGNSIIRFVNRFIEEDSIAAPSQKEVQQVIDPQKMAAIVSAIQIVSQGKAKVVKVEKR